MNMLMIISFTNSVLLLIVNHPLMMTIMIMMQSLITSLILGWSLPNPWMAFILFLIFMGGLMVLFIYISSLASNEMFNLYNFINKKLILSFMFVMTFFIIFYNNSPNIFLLQINHNNMVFKIYTFEMMYLSLMIMLILLFILVVAVKMIFLKKGPLRSLM